MKRMTCDYEGCKEERQILSMDLPTNWFYIDDFEYCPNCKDKIKKELNKIKEQEYECFECSFVFESKTKPKKNDGGEYVCEDCLE